MATDTIRYRPEDDNTMEAPAMTSQDAKPKARTEDVLARELESGETVVYDRKTDAVHCLNRSAALVWKHSDGSRSVRELASLLHGELGLPDEAGVVHVALAELGKANLVDADVAGLTSAAGVTRRQALGRVGYGVAIAALLPAVASIVAPRPAAAASCLPVGAGCTSDTDCCSRSCVAGICAPILPV